MRHKRGLLSAGMLLLASGAAAADTVVVYVYSNDFSLNPRGEPVVDAVIRVGDTIRWLWDGGFHDTLSVEGSAETWASPATAELGFTFDHTFTHVGEFSYYCSIHGYDNFDGTAGGMAGTITVRCSADWDLNGSINTLDFIGYLNDFNAADESADLDGNGTINTLDFLLYLNAFNTPCP